MNKAKTISLADHLGIDGQTLKDKGVLNAILGIDTKLFIDPKLLEKVSIFEFSNSLIEIRHYFEELLKINNQASKSERLLERSINMIAVKEPVGLSIGYGNSRDSGTAIPRSVAKRSLASLNEMLAVGVEDLTVMELLGLFTEGFGPDSISDLMASIQYARLCEFTQRISKELGIATKEFTINEKKYKLPIHPFRNKQLIFLPLEILSPLPLATSWDEMVDAARENAAVRKKFNEIVGKEVKKFISGIKKNSAMFTRSLENINLLLQIYKDAKVLPYDIKVDSLAYERIAEHLTSISKNEAPKIECKSGVEMINFVNDMILAQFKRDIEQLGANRLLYHRKGEAVDETRPVHEEAAQIILHLTADQLCKNSNIMVSRETKTGVGSVDFSIGNGYSNKAVVEVKKSSNNDLINGYERQLKMYLEAEAASCSFYVVVVVRRQDLVKSNSQLNKLKLINEKNIKDGISCPKLVIVNGLIIPTASKKSNDI